MSEDLRRRAEQLLETKPENKPEVSTKDVQELVYELQLHQAELEVQNEELKEAQRQLEKSRDAYMELYDFAPIGYLTLDQHDVINETNHTAAAMLKKERGKLVGCRFRQFIQPDVQTQWFHHRRALRSSGEKRTVELELRKDDGTPLTVRLDCRPQGESEAREWRCLVALIDITEKTQAVNALNKTHEELQQAYEQLQETQSQLVDQERQRALTTMVHGVAHDFNNSLSPILGFAELLLNYPENRQDDEKLTRYLQRIQTSANQAAETIRRLRKFYRPGKEEKFTEIDLHHTISEAVSSTKPRWQEESRATGIPINVETDFGDLPPLQANEAEIHEVLTSLIFNAVDALPEGGTIHIRTQARRQDILLEVTDDGTGMTEETRRVCMEPFFTTKGPKGSGLGLATIQGIVHRHEGEVNISSQEGRGTTVSVTLPRPSARSTGQTDYQEGNSNLLHILVVEDDSMQQELLTDLLGQNGHKLDVAADGKEALRYLRNSTYDLVITDRAMPEMSGDQVAVKVKEIAPQTSVIMLTGFGDMMDAAGEKPPSIDALVSKPITTEKLQKTIREVV